MTKTEELLAVLDMSEKEQWRWICDQRLFEYFTIHIAGTVENKTFLADLAFRLRDEVVKVDGNAVKLNLGMWYVYRRAQYQDHRFDYPPCGTEQGLASAWFAYYAKPIHFIIAALIAKQKEDEE